MFFFLVPHERFDCTLWSKGGGDYDVTVPLRCSWKVDRFSFKNDTPTANKPEIWVTTLFCCFKMVCLNWTRCRPARSLENTCYYDGSEGVYSFGITYTVYIVVDLSLRNEYFIHSAIKWKSRLLVLSWSTSIKDKGKHLVSGHSGP